MSALFFERGALASELARLRRQQPGLRVVLANGCFDLLHVGHVRYLEHAKRLGELLVVALNTDESVRQLKGPGRPFVPLAERAELIGALFCVDFVTSFAERDLSATLQALLPTIHAKGTDYTAESVPEADLDRRLGIGVAICGDPKTHSSTQLGQPGWIARGT